MNKNNIYAESFSKKLIETQFSLSLVLQACREGKLITKPGFSEPSNVKIKTIPGKLVEGYKSKYDLDITVDIPSIDGSDQTLTQTSYNVWWVSAKENNWSHDWYSEEKFKNASIHVLNPIHLSSFFAREIPVISNVFENSQFLDGTIIEVYTFESKGIKSKDGIYICKNWIGVHISKWNSVIEKSLLTRFELYADPNSPYL